MRRRTRNTPPCSANYMDITEVTEDEFDVAELRNLRPVAMLFQSGYLTIKGYEDGLYKLGVPDEEVRRDLAKTVTGVIADESTAENQRSRPFANFST